MHTYTNIIYSQYNNCNNYYYSQILSAVISLSVTESFSSCFPNHTCSEGSALRVHSFVTCISVVYLVIYCVIIILHVIYCVTMYFISCVLLYEYEIDSE